MIKINLFNLVAKLSLNDDDYKNGIDNAKGGAEGLGGTFKKVGGIIATVFAVDKIKDFTKSVIKMGIDYNASIEQSTVAWTTLLGSQEKAKGMIEDISKYAATTPFSKMGVDAMAKQLHNAGFKGEELFKQLTKFGDMGGAFGVQEDSLKEMVRQYAQVQMATVAYTEDLNILQDRGIPIYKGLSEVLNVSVADVKKMASEGKISADIYNKAIDSIAKNTKGSMEAQSKTFNGMISTLKDNLGVLAGKLAEPIFNKLLEQLPKVMDFLDKLISNIGEGQGFLEGFANAVEDTFGESTANKVRIFTNTLQLIMDNINGIATALVGVATGMAVFKTVNMVMGMVKAYKAWRLATEGMTIAQALLNAVMMLNPIGIIIGLIAGLVAAIIYLWNTNDGFKNSVLNAWNSIKECAFAVWGSVKKFFMEDIPQAWENVKKSFEGVKEFFAKIPAFFKGVWDSVMEKFREWGNSISNFFTETIPATIESFVNWWKELPYKIGFIMGQLLAICIQKWEEIKLFFTETIPQIIENIVEWFSSLPQFFSDVWESIKQKTGEFLEYIIKSLAEFVVNTWEKLKACYTNVVNWGSDMWEKAKEIGKNFIDGIIEWFKQLPNRIYEWFQRTIERVVNFATDLKNRAMDAGREFTQNLIDAVKDLPNKMMSIGSDIVKGVWNGISNMGSWIMGKVKGFFSGIVDGAKSILGIHSPSRVFSDEVGKFMAEGVGVGFEDEISNVNATIGKSLETTVIQPNSKTKEQQQNNLVFFEMLTTLKGILNKDTTIEIEGREVARSVAPYQGEFIEFDKRNPKWAY